MTQTIFSSDEAMHRVMARIDHAYVYAFNTEKPVHYGGLFTHRPMSAQRRKFTKYGAVYLIKIKLKRT